MREYDENIRLYTPMLQRIIILVAVIIAVPVVLWTITAFVRTYVGPPQLPTFRPLAATPPQTTPVQVAAQTVDTATDARTPLLEIKKPASGEPLHIAAVNPSPAPLQMPQTPLAAPDASSANAVSSAPAPAVAPVVVPPPPFAAPRATRSTLAAPPNFALPNVTPPQITATAPSNPAATTSNDPSLDAQPGSLGPPPAQMAASDATADDLPAGTPLKGRIPLPLHKPSIAPAAGTGTQVALAGGAVTPPGRIPLPRARPASAPDAGPAADLPYPAYDPSQIH